MRLSEEEAIAVIDGLREALRASKAVIAGREAAQDGGPAAGS